MSIIGVFLLILLNGFLSMAEIAIVSVKKSRLQQLRDQGSRRADAAYRLSEHPNMFFSTIQIGITLIGILSGAITAVAFSQPIESILRSIGIVESISHSIALFCVVLLTTYVSIVFGELVPKRLGLHFSEKVSVVIARPMLLIAKVFSPIITIFSWTTDLILRPFRLAKKTNHIVSQEEVRFLIAEGAQNGTFKRTEKHIVERTLSLSEVRVNALMTAKSKIVWVDVSDPIENVTAKVIKNPYSYFPVCEGSLDKVIGIISGDVLLASVIAEKKIHIRDLMYKPLMIPAHVIALNVLELFKKNKIHQGIVIDEYGNTEGLVTLTDILEAIVGNFPEPNQPEEKKIMQRNKSSWYVDGLVTIPQFKTHFKIREIPDEKNGGFNTIGGFVMHKLGRMPVTGDHIDLNGYKIEVADMDGNRVDKVIVNAPS